MPAFEVPAEIVTRFRAQANDRLERIEKAWAQLGRRPDDRTVALALRRDLHTLKGDAHLVGFRDVALLLHKLEELLAIAERRGFRVSEELDLVVTMAIGFAGMLIRKRIGTDLPGIDLEGFVRQVDDVIADAASGADAEPEVARSAADAQVRRDTLSAEARARLAQVATDTFVEALAAGPVRPRLDRAWRTLVEELAVYERVRLDEHLARHAESAKGLAAELGKAVDIDFRVAAIDVAARLADALDAAMVHVLRNAIDHGIEPPDVRGRRHKRGTGAIVIRAGVVDQELEVVVEDDGAGLDLDAVRRRAVEVGLASADATLSRAELIELLFAPGFSTRTAADQVSGRGMGMDAVRTAVAAEGGRVAVTSIPEQGTIVSLHLPLRDAEITVQQFPIAGGVLVAVDAAWEAAEAAAEDEAIDLAGLLDLRAEPDAHRIAFVRGDARVTVRAAGWPVRSSARRICRTADDHIAEIVRFETGDGLLIHDHVLGGAA